MLCEAHPLGGLFKIITMSEKELRISRRRKVIFIIALSIFSIWGAILGFGNPFNCGWPNTEELMTGSEPSATLVTSGLDSQSLLRLETAILQRVVHRGFSQISFDPERDFISHNTSRSPNVWKFEGDEFVVVNERILAAAMQSPVGMEAFMSGIYPRLFRFSITHAGASHACVIVELEEPVGGRNLFEFWQFFRLGFGFGKWWGFSQGGIFFGW